VSTVGTAGRFARLLLALGLTAYLIFWKSDPSSILEAFARAQWMWVAAALTLVVLDRLLNAWRWIALLDADTRRRVPASRLLRIFLVSTFVGTFFPGGVGGDVMRAWSLSREEVAGSRAAGSVLMDRLLGVIALVLLAAIGLFVGRHLLPERFLLVALGGAAAASVVGLVAVYSNTAETILLKVAARLPSALRTPVSRLVGVMRAYSARHGVVAAVFVMSLLVNILRVLQTWFLGLAIDLPQGPIAYFAFVPMICVLMMLPISVAGLGVAQAAFVWFFAHAGVASADALALSFLFIGLAIFGNLPGAFAYAVLPGDRGTETARSR
jgi:uncharacterized protein (TIRG00374 family)